MSPSVPSYGFALNNSGDISIDDGNVITDYVQIAFTAFGGFTSNINTTCTIEPVVPNPAVPPTLHVSVFGGTAAPAQSP